MNLLLVLIIIGLCVAHFGFWSTVGAFFVGIIWLIVIVLVIIGAIAAFAYVIDNLR